MALSTIPVDVDDVAPSPEPEPTQGWDTPKHVCTVCAEFAHHSHGDDPWQQVGVCVTCLKKQAHTDMCELMAGPGRPGRRFAA